MPSPAEYQRRVQVLDWDGLLHLWSRIMAGQTPGWESGKAFEYLVLRAFELDGAEVRWPFRVVLEDEEVEQIDGVVYAAGLSCLLEVKDTEEAVTTGPLAKLRNQLLRRPGGTLGLLFSRSDFTSPAQKLAQFMAPQSILLWTGLEVEVALRRRAMVEGLLVKYRRCVEEGIPDLDLRLEWLKWAST